MAITSTSYLAICEGDDGIPLWKLPPTRENIPVNAVVVWLPPYHACIVVHDQDDETSLVVHDGHIAYAVTACLFEI